MLITCIGGSECVAVDTIAPQNVVGATVSLILAQRVDNTLQQRINSFEFRLLIGYSKLMYRSMRREFEQDSAVSRRSIPKRNNW
jgi:hypothetical protein